MNVAVFRKEGAKLRFFPVHDDSDDDFDFCRSKKFAGDDAGIRVTRLRLMNMDGELRAKRTLAKKPRGPVREQHSNRAPRPSQLAPAI